MTESPKATNAVVRNADNNSLMPVDTGFSVDEVNGAGATEVAGFVATRHELIQLAKYWLREKLEVDWFWFFYSLPPGPHICLSRFADRRINRIEALLGEEEFAKVLHHVVMEFQEDPKH